MEMKSGSLLKEGPVLCTPLCRPTPPRMARTTALLGPSFGLCTASVVNIGLGSPFTTFRAYRSLLSTASVRCGVPSRWEGPVSCYLPKQVRDCGAWNMEMKWGSLLKSGSGVAPPRPARSAALPGPSFGLCTASVVNIGLGSPFTTFRAYRSLFSTASAMEDHPSAHHLISAAFGSLRKTSSLHAYLFEFIL